MPSDDIALVLFFKKVSWAKLSFVAWEQQTPVMVSLLLNFCRKCWVITNKSISCFVIIVILNQLHKVEKGYIKIHSPDPQPPWPSMVITFEMEKCKTRTTEADLGMFTHILVYSCIFRDIQVWSDILRNDSDIFRTLRNPGILRTLVCSELWNIHIHRHTFRTLLYS